MASFGPGFSAAPNSLSAEINSSSANDENDFNNSDPLHLLSQGIEQTIRIDRRMMLEKTMECLGAQVATTFSVIETADAGVKVSIKLDVSRLPTVSGQRIRLSVVEGDSFLDPAGAEFSAVMKAFNHLEKNHLVRMVDFSSRVARSLGLESSNTFVLFNQANSCLKKVFEQWVLAFGKFENFAGSHESKESPDPFSGAPTDGAKVCGLLSDYLSSLHSTLRDKLDDIRSQMEDIELYRRHYIRKIAKRGQLYSSNGNMHEVQFTSKDTLNYVLSFYGIDFAEYTDCPKPDDLVESTVGFEFPYMPNFKFAGNIRISGMAYTSHDADEEAAYKALLFIENNFITKVADFNYIQPQKALKLQNTDITDVQGP